MKERQNIFNIINSRRNPLEEIKRIDELLKDDYGVYVSDEIFQAITKGTPISIEKYIDNYLYKKWIARGTCICTSDLKEILGINQMSYNCEQNEDIDYILRYCEYAANMVYLIKHKVLAKDTLSDNADTIIENLQIFLNWYNYEVKYYPDEEKALVIAKNASATAVAEIINSELSYDIVEYNHYLLKGNIEKKKSILLALGNDLEPKRKQLSVIDKDLSDDIFFMLNNLNLRHNNKKKGDKNYHKKVANMKKNKLEEWYDELYQLLLSAYILLDNVSRKEKISDLKNEIKQGDCEND